MNTLRFSLCLLAVLAFSFSAHAQKYRIGFLAGPLLTQGVYDFPEDITFMNPEPIGNSVVSWSAEMGIGFTVGASLDYNFTDKIHLSTGLNINSLRHSGKRSEHYEMGTPKHFEDNFEYSVYALQIPLLAHFQAGKFNAGAGVYGAWSLGGARKVTYSADDQVSEYPADKLIFSSDEMVFADFIPYDAGVRLEAGFGVKRWRLMGFADLGMVNIVSMTPNYDYPIQEYPLTRNVFGIFFLYHPWPR